MTGFETFASFVPELAELLAREDVSEVQVNGPSAVYAEVAGRLEEQRMALNEKRLVTACELMAQRWNGVELSDLNPIIDTRLPDGSRIAIAIPPASVDGVVLTIRKHQIRYYSLEALVETGMLPDSCATLLHDAVEKRRNIVICGQTGSGKTTLLNALLRSIPEDERVITVEDTVELDPPQKNRVRFEAQPAAAHDGTPTVSIQKLVQASLRHTPGRLIIGEFRGAEALDCLIAMNTGHSGTLLSAHANGPEDALDRFFLCCTLASKSIPPEFLQQAIARNIHLTVYLEKVKRTRVVVSVGSVRRYNREREAFECELVYSRSGCHATDSCCAV
jgi:pilus assembly protein CpaF